MLLVRGHEDCMRRSTADDKADVSLIDTTHRHFEKFMEILNGHATTIRG